MSSDVLTWIVLREPVYWNVCRVILILIFDTYCTKNAPRLTFSVFFTEHDVSSAQFHTFPAQYAEVAGPIDRSLWFIGPTYSSERKSRGIILATTHRYHMYTTTNHQQKATRNNSENILKCTPLSLSYLSPSLPLSRPSHWHQESMFLLWIASVLKVAEQLYAWPKTINSSLSSSPRIRSFSTWTE